TEQDTSKHLQTVGRAVQWEAAAMAADWRSRDAAAWQAPTACREWRVRDVAAHVTDGAERAVVVARAALAGEPVPQYDTAERRRGPQPRGGRGPPADPAGRSLYPPGLGALGPAAGPGPRRCTHPSPTSGDPDSQRALPGSLARGPPTHRRQPA